MKNIALLGSTGSIGVNTLKVIARHPREFRVVGLGAHTNIELLARQVLKFRPEFVHLNDAAYIPALRSKLGSYRKVKFFVGSAGFKGAFSGRRIDRIVLAIGGSGALVPLWVAVEHGIPVALANKEALVMAGALVMEAVRKRNIPLIPIDSEQSAIWQCLHGQEYRALKTLYLTASGGPLREHSRRQLTTVTPKEVLRHPRWKMGRKITVDSATLMNKGLEVIEAMHLFGVGLKNIRVLVHPEAIIHSMVEFIDGVVLAQLAVADMRIPIQYALSYPRRLPAASQALDFSRLGALHFEKPDFARFPCLGLAYAAAREGGTAPCVLNASDEVCVEHFLRSQIGFSAIPRVIERVLSRNRNAGSASIQDILAADNWARAETLAQISRLHR